MQTNSNGYSDELLEKIQDLQKLHFISYATCDGIMTQDVHTFLKQPIDGILYDLNRDKATTIALAKDEESSIGHRWVNDLAVAFVIAKLKEKIDKLENNENKDTL